MIIIGEPETICTVIVTVDAELDDLPELEAHARAGLEWFKAYDGFIGGALHKARDGGRLVQYLQWETEQHQVDCMNDPAWDEKASAARFMARVRDGSAAVDVRVYEVVAASKSRS